MGFFTRKCKQCGEEPQLQSAAHIEGRVGSSAVEFTNFPYRKCRCGHVVRWAFDPGSEFSDQLFYEGGIPIASGRRGDPSCRECKTSLAAQQEVTLHASANLDGFPPLEMTVRLLGYRCTTCGLEQAPPHEFDFRGAPETDSGRALHGAVESIGLDS